MYHRNRRHLSACTAWTPSGAARCCWASSCTPAWPIFPQHDLDRRRRQPTSIGASWPVLRHPPVPDDELLPDRGPVRPYDAGAPGLVRVRQGSGDPHRRPADRLLVPGHGRPSSRSLIWTAAHRNGGSIPDAPPPPPPTYDWTNFPLTHLWFLYVLMLFYAAAADPARAVRDAGPERRLGAGRGQDHRRPDRAVDARRARRAAGRGHVAGRRTGWPSSACRRRTRVWSRTPPPWSGSAWPSVWASCWIVVATCWAGSTAWWPLFTVVAVVSGAAAMILAGGPEPRADGRADRCQGHGGGGDGAGGLSPRPSRPWRCRLRFLSGHSAIRRYLADASYWVYIVHLPLVMVGPGLGAGLGRALVRQAGGDGRSASSPSAWSPMSCWSATASWADG